MNGLVLALVICVIAAFAAAPSAKPATGTAAAAKKPESAAQKLSKFQQLQREKFKNSAPADEYFGKMKMSFLGMNNTFHDAAITSGEHTTDPRIANKVALADDALMEWSRRFPRDPQLARTYFLAIRSDKKIWLQPNQQRAWVYMKRMVSLFPDTYFGKLVKKDMAIGYTEHYYAEAMLCPADAAPVDTPTPVASLAPAQRGGRATPAPVVTPTPEPTPSPTPSPAPTPRELEKGLKVQIETPACVPRPTPTPSASPVASPAAPAPAVSGAPLPPVATMAPRPLGAPSPAPSAKPHR